MEDQLAAQGIRLRDFRWEDIRRWWICTRTRRRSGHVGAHGIFRKDVSRR